MKSKEQILTKILIMQNEIIEIHEKRMDLIARNGGIDFGQNTDMISDIATLANQIKILEWVLS
jgi:hypothetical protein